MNEGFASVTFSALKELPQYSGAQTFFSKLFNRKSFGDKPVYTDKIVTFMVKQRIVRPLML